MKCPGRLWQFINLGLIFGLVSSAFWSFFVLYSHMIFVVCLINMTSLSWLLRVFRKVHEEWTVTWIFNVFGFFFSWEGVLYVGTTRLVILLANNQLWFSYPSSLSVLINVNKFHLFILSNTLCGCVQSLLLRSAKLKYTIFISCSTLALYSLNWCMRMQFIFSNFRLWPSVAFYWKELVIIPTKKIFSIFINLYDEWFLVFCNLILKNTIFKLLRVWNFLPFSTSRYNEQIWTSQSKDSFVNIDSMHMSYIFKWCMLLCIIFFF